MALGYVSNVSKILFNEKETLPSHSLLRCMALEIAWIYSVLLFAYSSAEHLESVVPLILVMISASDDGQSHEQALWVLNNLLADKNTTKHLI